MDHDDFLLEEYKNACHLTFHIDELRSKLTSFFLTFSSITVAVLLLLLKDDFSEIITFPPELIVVSFLLLEAFIGICIVLVLARLRKVQIEHFRIINNIRTSFLKNNYELWNVVQLSSKTLPTPNKTSGSYYWLLMIVFVTSILLTVSTYILLSSFINVSDMQFNILFSLLVFILSIIVLHLSYFRNSTLPEQIIYSDNFKP